MNEDQIKTLQAWRDRLAQMPKGKLEVRTMTGKTPALACAIDQRFSFTAYIPKCHKFDGPELPLLVCAHGIARQTHLNTMIDFAEEQGCVVLAPLFPCGIEDLTDIHNYKTLVFHDIRFDLILLSMIQQASCIWRIRADKFFLHGFSAGGQFCHRFFYLHPHLLLGISIGAPGGITLPRKDRPWPGGISDIHEVFKIKGDSEGQAVPNFGEMAKVPVHFVVGEKDVDTSGIGDSLGPDVPGGGTRINRITALRDAWKEMGIEGVLDIVPGVGHEGGKIAPQVQQFLRPLFRNLHS
ncbi:alpha/beta-hydrolase [Gloeophyllum trabeum ATCC 11539]|uniref:Alpha/beta-hydrolase n=1 Tax=Gloeophyllum trabeum (strain ATCC 11539 / FP-39264 / Madison 617) TaxID=670483 RepID=S7QC28_GLOTA|nr:alpha/beta-hydrolase [Gloeophyllum trabeum ATCC 11539]EPQ56902.1 alpha/beta-hydrolase [Gloeophyllum trabeum ATCC 11539]